MSEKIDVIRQYHINTFGCGVNEVIYDLLKGTGHVHMPAGNCTDMKKTIEFFQSHVPDIGHILTWCDGEIDTQYVDHAGDGNWIAI